MRIEQADAAQVHDARRGAAIACLYIHTAMWVQVFELRCEGQKRPREEIRASRPVVGYLQMSPSRPGYYAGQRNAPMLACLFDPHNHNKDLLEPLDDARVTKIGRGGLLIVGVQETLRAVRRRDQHRQAWWCKPIPTTADL
jgi:hypothetical protein